MSIWLNMRITLKLRDVRCGAKCGGGSRAVHRPPGRVNGDGMDGTLVALHVQQALPVRGPPDAELTVALA